MYFSINRFTGDGTTTQWEFNFSGGYIDQAHVKVLVTDPLGVETVPAYTWVGPNTISIVPAVASGSTLEVYRDTPKNLPLVDYTDGAIVSEKNLNTTAEQSVFVAAEVADRFFDTETLVVGAATAAVEAAEIASIAAGAAATDADIAQVAASSAAASAESSQTALENIEADLDALVGGDFSDFLRGANNLSDVANAPTARINLGLGNVDNTADGDKPVSTAQASAIAVAAQDVMDTLAAASGSNIVGFQQAGTGAVATSVQSKLREFVSVKDFGAVGDGVADDTAAIQNAIASSRSIFFPPGNYLIGTQITINASDIKLHGVGAASKITSSTLKNVIRLTGLNRAVFEDLAFETTVNNATENVYGVVWAANHPLTDVSFLRCYFYAPNANTNGVKIISEDADISDQVRFIECRFEGIQRMGIEWQNHVYDAVTRYRGITVERCTFKDLGVGVGFGYAISLSGQGENCAILNNTFENIKLGLELIGASDTTVAFNKFRSFGASGRPFSFSGTAVTMFRNRLIGNTMEARGAGPLFYTQQDFVMQGNYWLTSSALSFRGVVRGRFSDEHVDSTGAQAVFIEGTSSDNQFVNCRISNQSAPSNQATFRTSGAGVTDTRLIGCHTLQGTGGVTRDAISSAQVAAFLLHKTNLGAVPESDPFRIGRKTSWGVRKVAGAGLFATTVTIDFGTASSWEPAVVKLKIASSSTSGGNSGYTENVLFVRHITGSVVVDSNQVIGTASNLTVTTSASGNVLTLTCTHATAATNTYMWDVEVSCLNNPVLA